MSEIKNSFNFGRSTYASPIMLKTEHSNTEELLASLDDFRCKKKFKQNGLASCSKIGLFGNDHSISTSENRMLRVSQFWSFPVFRRSVFGHSLYYLGF